jgi:hypothetical protein
VSEEQATVRYEERDIIPRYVLYVGFGVLACVIAIVFVMHLLFSYMRHLKAVESPATSPVARQVYQYPPEPRLQAAPALDYQTMYYEDQWLLHHYEWVDKQKGVVAIPIDRAIDLIARRGIAPSTAPPSQFYTPAEGDRLTGFEERKEPEP